MKPTPSYPYLHGGAAAADVAARSKWLPLLHRSPNHVLPLQVLLLLLSREAQHGLHLCTDADIEHPERQVCADNASLMGRGGVG